MSAEISLEQRVETLEAAVRDLQQRLNSKASAANWLDRVIGSFRDEPAFEEVLEYGRQFRQADRPAEDPGS